MPQGPEDPTFWERERNRHPGACWPSDNGDRSTVLSATDPSHASAWEYSVAIRRRSVGLFGDRTGRREVMSIPSKGTPLPYSLIHNCDRHSETTPDPDTCVEPGKSGLREPGRDTH